MGLFADAIDCCNISLGGTSERVMHYTRHVAGARGKP
jgi:hypothetical protein